MSFLNDKKNQPIVIGGLVAVLLAVGVYFYFMTRPPAPDVTASSDTGATNPAAQGPPTPPPATAAIPAPAAQTAAAQPPASPAPGMAVAAAAGPQASGPIKPREKFRADRRQTRLPAEWRVSSSAKRFPLYWKPARKRSS